MDATTLPEQPPVLRPREPPRRLWQAPVFVLGLGVFVAFWFCQPYFKPDSNRIDARVIKGVREDLGRDNCDLAATVNTLKRLLDRGVPEELAGEAHFLYGTAEIRLAETAEAGLARNHWLTAHDQLDEAEKQGVPEADQAKLQYRLGKVGFYLESESANKVADRLAGSVTAADDKAEGYNLLTDAYLRLTPPNLEAALAANEQLRLLMAPDETLARAKLKGGEILLRMRRPKEALEVLERVGNQAPPAILTRARMLRAQCKQEERLWDAAVTLWQTALDGAVTPPEAASIRYNLGLCYVRLELRESAAPIWDECVKTSNGDEKYAAALGLAELHVQTGNGDKALESMELALRSVQKPEDWNNKLLDRAQAGALIERCCQTARQAGKFELVMGLVALYERLAMPGRALVMRGDVAADWARARRDRVQKQTPGSPSVSVEEQAVRELFKQSAEAYEEAAKKAADKPEHGEYLWLATSRYLDAGEQAKAQALLGELFQLTPRPDTRLGEGWYLLGESFRTDTRPESGSRDKKMRDADRVYRESMKYETQFAYWARYRIAQFKIEQGKIDDAVAELEQIIRMLPGEEIDVKQRARFTLVDLCYEAGKPENLKTAKPEKLKTVVDQMEQVLEHLPATAEATLARYELADSYRLLADDQEQLLNDGTTYRDPGTREHYKEVCKHWRERAIVEYENVIAIIEKPGSADHLDLASPKKGPKARRDLYYFAAYTCFQMGQWDKSLAAYQRMALRYKDKPDEWTAVAGKVSSYTGMGDEKRVREGLDLISANLRNMDPATQKAMEQYIRNVEMSLKRQFKP